MSKRSLIVAVVGVVAAAAGPAAAVEASGTAVAVLLNTAASGPGGDRALVADGPVFTGDVIKTDKRGTAQILFADKTKMVIGPQSQVTIDKFVFQGPSKDGAFSINAVRGSFRFITGVSAKNSYSISTPVATIGVRGTEFDGHVADDGTTTLAMWHGSVRICDKATPRRHCTVISGACSVIQLSPDTGFNWVNDIYKRTELVDHSIPFAFRQGGLTGGFRVASGGCDTPNVDSAAPSRHSHPPPPPTRSRNRRTDSLTQPFGSLPAGARPLRHGTCASS